MKKIILVYLLFVFTQAGAQWNQMNGPNTGVIKFIDINGPEIFTCVNDNGISFVFHSIDSGLTWKDVSLDTIYHITQAKSLVRSGTNIFAVSYNHGVYLSTDHGDNWTQVNSGLTTLYPLSMVVNGTNLFVSTGSGIFLSTNNGSNWSLTSSGLAESNIRTFATDGVNIFGGTSHYGALLSADNGNTWMQVNTGLTDSVVNCFAIDGPNIFAGTDSDGVFLSTNNGSSWTNIGLSDTTITSLAVSGSNLFAGTKYGVFLSTDTGITWTPMNNGLTNYWGSVYRVYSLAIGNTSVFAGTRNGLFFSPDNGNNWSITGCPALRINAFAQIGTNLFCGGYDNNNGNGGMFLSLDSGMNWISKTAGLPSTDIRTLAAKGTAIFAGLYGSGVVLSTDTGNTWVTVNNGITDNSVRSIVTMGNNIFAGSGNSAAQTGAIFLSTNDGSSWTDITPGDSSIDIWNLFVFGTGIFAGTADGVYFSSDTGNTWTLRNNGLLNYGASAFATIGSTIYVGNGSGIYSSSDTGMHWTAVAGNGLPGSIYDIRALFETNGILFTALAATGGNNSIYASMNNGNNWINLNDGLTDREGFSFDTIGNNILAGTYGSVFKRPISEIAIVLDVKPLPVSHSDFEIYPNPAKDYLTIQFEQTIKNASIEIYNLIGDKVASELMTNTQTKKITLKNFSAGIYFVRVTDGNNQYTRKLIVRNE